MAKRGVLIVGLALVSTAIAAPTVYAATSADDPVAQAEYALPLPHDALPRDEYDDPHHDYPAIDLPVPTGTDAFAVTEGDAEVFTDSSCGNGVELTGTDGVLYTYCHFDSHAVESGHVAAGAKLGDTGTTGDSTGPHLHFQIKTDGTLRCPQNMLLALYDGQPPPPATELPTEGCSNFTAHPKSPPR
jgi:murein DD-endopeptidase MepM/ murein hydrolase activator NlpD